MNRTRKDPPPGLAATDPETRAIELRDEIVRRFHGRADSAAFRAELASAIATANRELLNMGTEPVDGREHAWCVFADEFDHGAVGFGCRLEPVREMEAGR